MFESSIFLVPHVRHVMFSCYYFYMMYYHVGETTLPHIHMEAISAVRHMLTTNDGMLQKQARLQTS